MYELCNYSSCMKERMGHKYCKKHIRQKQVVKEQKCLVENCNINIYFDNLCWRHYFLSVRHLIIRYKPKEDYKIKLVNHYSDGKNICACCGEDNMELLTIDHIFENGYLDKYKFNDSRKFYKHLINNNFPFGYQILCHNCNFAKGMYGYCPHLLK